MKSVFNSSKLKIYTISFLAYSGILYTVLTGIAMYCVLNHAGYFTSSKVWLMFFIAVVLTSLQFCIYYLFTSLICVKKQIARQSKWELLMNILLVSSVFLVYCFLNIICIRAIYSQEIYLWLGDWVSEIKLMIFYACISILYLTHSFFVVKKIHIWIVAVQRLLIKKGKNKI